MNIDVYMHVATMGRYEEIAEELAGHIYVTGLEDHARRIFVSIVGSGLMPFIGDRWCHIVNAVDVNAYEYPTLEHIWRDVREDESPGATLYIHTKGASHPPGPRDTWRQYMSYFCIDRWRECVQRLEEGYDVVGTEYRGPTKSMGAHFAGNFWWARADWIRQLSEPVPFRDRRHIRYGAETWLFRHDPPPKAFSWMDFSRRYDLSKDLLPATEYRHGAQRADGVR